MLTARSIMALIGTILCILALTMLNGTHAAERRSATATISVNVSESFLQYLTQQRANTSTAGLSSPSTPSVPDSTKVLQSKN